MCLQIAAPLDLQDLLPLANLHSLEHLKIWHASQMLCDPSLSAQLFGGLTALTALTALTLSGCPVACLAHVGSCVALRVLVMYCPDGLEEEPGSSEWAAVGKLTGLVELQLYNAKLLTPSRDWCAAVSKLTGLQRLGTWLWSARMLAAVAACTKLTQLVGGWQEDDSRSADGVVLKSVVELKETFGSPPFAAFPNLVAVQQWDCMAPDAFVSMTLHCTRLRELTFAYAPRGPSLARVEPLSARITALKALSPLTSLTRLECVCLKSHELMAVVHVVGTLLPKGFQRLRLDVPPGAASRVPVTFVLQLAKLQGLPELLLQVGPAASVALARDIELLLSALSGIKSVAVVGLMSDGVDAWVAARQRLDELGLPCIKSLTVHGFVAA
jgi:hypothetical protein